jgi:hypothetical protein
MIYAIARHSLLLLMLINLTVAENKWVVFGLRPDQFIYAATILLAWHVGYLSKYRIHVTLVLVLAILLRVADGIGMGGGVFHQLSFFLLGIMFAFAGALIYGKDPDLLHKQLIGYLAVCVPIMLMQILGVSSWLMGWNTGYMHDPSMLTIEEVGTFKDIPVYPTLFVEAEDLLYSVGQGRPVGLMYGSNPLSVFICFALALNLAIKRKSRFRFSDAVVTLAIVLTMSRLVFGVTILLYLWFLISRKQGKRDLVLKLTAATAITFFLYFFFFPGLFYSNFTPGIIMSSIMLRSVDLLKASGMYDLFNSSGQLGELMEIYRPSFTYEIGEGYSSVATLLRSRMLIPVLLVVFFGAIVYMNRLRRMPSGRSTVYVVTLATCFLTQLAVPFINTPSFQLVAGFALFPLLWETREAEAAQPGGAQAMDSDQPESAPG